MATPVTPTPKPKKKLNLSLIGLLAVIALAGGGYYYYSTYYQPIPAGTTEDVGAPELTVLNTDWDKAIFQDPTYTSLKSPIALPLTSGPKGNPNPFIEEVK